MTNLMNSGKPKQWQEHGLLTPVSIFHVSEIDWVAAESPEVARDCYLRLIATGHQGPDDPADIYEIPRLVTEDRMNTMTYQDDEDSRVVRTFREELDRRIADGQTFPQFFASSEF